MTKFAHRSSTYSAEIGISADDFFDAAADWQGIAGILPAEHPYKFSKVELVSGSVNGQAPCTRRMFLDKSSLPEDVAGGLPDYFQETMLVADKEAGTIVYRVEGETLGMRNYYGIKEIEPIDDKRCRVTIWARYDFPLDADADGMNDGLVTVYKGVIHGAEQARRS